MRFRDRKEIMGINAKKVEGKEKEKEEVYVNENEIEAPMIEADGEGITIREIDPDLPYGSVSDDEISKTEDEWIEENYPDKTREDLANMGINVEFVPGEETYEIKGEGVTEEEFNDYINSQMSYHDYVDNYNNLSYEERSYISEIKENENESLYYYHKDSADGYGGIDEEVALHHKEPGRMKIHYDSSKCEEYIQSVLNQEITKEEEEKLNEFFQKALGVGHISLKGKSVYDAYSDIVDLSKAKGIKAKNLQISFVIISVIEDPLMDMLGLKDIWDADYSDLANVINKGAKLGSFVLTFAGAIELATGGTASFGLLIAGVVCTFIDGAIAERDEYDIFKVGEDGSIVYDFTLPFGQSNVHYSGEIHLDYENPEHLANQIYAYFVTAKLELLRSLNVLAEKRKPMIELVKEDVANDMLALTSANSGSSTIDRNDDKVIERMCEVYGIEPCLYFTIPPYNPKPETLELEEGEECRYSVGFEYRYSYSTMRYLVKKVDVSTPLKSLDDLMFEGSLFRADHAVLSQPPTDEELQAHQEKYYFSYYAYYHNENEQIKNDYVDAMAGKDCLNISEVDMVLYPQYGIKAKAKVDDKACFMDLGVNISARDVVEAVYESISLILSEYATASGKINELEQGLVSAWKK